MLVLQLCMHASVSLLYYISYSYSYIIIVYYVATSIYCSCLHALIQFLHIAIAMFIAIDSYY